MSFIPSAQKVNGLISGHISTNYVINDTFSELTHSLQSTTDGGVLPLSRCFVMATSVTQFSFQSWKKKEVLKKDG